MSKFYHYTTQRHLKEIYESGVIKTTESNVSVIEHSGPDVVWLFNERITKVPKMLYSQFAGVQVPKCEVELIVDLDKSELSRADKFMKRHHADPKWLRALEETGGCKFTNQYIIEREIQVDEIVASAIRADLMKPVHLDKWSNR